MLEDTLSANPSQRAAIDEALRTAQVIRNEARRLWMESRGVGQYDRS
jgi:hypothetical protein